MNADYFDKFTRNVTDADIVEMYDPPIGHPSIPWVNNWRFTLPVEQASQAVTTAYPGLEAHLRSRYGDEWLWWSRLRWVARRAGILPEIEGVLLARAEENLTNLRAYLAARPEGA